MARIKLTPQTRQMILALVVIGATYFLASQVVAEVRAIASGLRGVAQEMEALRISGISIANPVTVVGCTEAQKSEQEPESGPCDSEVAIGVGTLPESLPRLSVGVWSWPGDIYADVTGDVDTRASVDVWSWPGDIDADVTGAVNTR